MTHASRHPRPSSPLLPVSSSPPAARLQIHDPESPSPSSPEPSLDWTWPRFFRSYVRPRMKQEIASHKRRKRGIEPYKEAVGHWRRLTCNSSLGSTSREDCDSFVRRLFRLPGRRGPRLLFRRSRRWGSWLRVRPQPEPGERQRLLARAERDYRLCRRITQNTVHKICNQMEIVFHWAGLPSKKLRHAADLFSGADAEGRPRRLPWLDSPGRIDGDERVFTQPELLAWLAACRYAACPQIAGVAPADWWRALIRVIYYTGLRKGTVLAARYTWIVEKEGDRWLEVPGRAMKAKRPEPICLKSNAMAAIDSIRRPGRDVIFDWPWPACGSHQPLYVECERLQELAGIPPERRFRFHAIRACAGDALYDLNPEMAREALCHKDLRTTEQSYTRKATRRARRAAAAAMPELGEGQRTLFELNGP